MTRPPYAPPPKYGPEVLGHAEWQRQQDAHERWLAWAENSYESAEGSGGGGSSPSGDAPRDVEQEEQSEQEQDAGDEIDKIARAAVEMIDELQQGTAEKGGEQGQDSDQQQDSSQEQTVSGETKRFNVYVRNADTKKRIAQAKGVEIDAEIAGDELKRGEALAKATYESLAKQLGTSPAGMAMHLREGVWEVEITQPRGKPFKKGSDPRRMQEGGQETTGGNKSPGARRKGKGSQGGGGQGAADSQDDEQGEQEQGGEQPPMAEWEQELIDQAAELQELMERMGNAASAAYAQGEQGEKAERDLVLLREKAEPLKGQQAVRELWAVAQEANASAFGRVLAETISGLDKLSAMLGTGLKGAATDLAEIRRRIEELQDAATDPQVRGAGTAQAGTAKVDKAQVEQIAQEVMKSAKIDLQAVAKALEPMLPKTRPVEVRVNGATKGTVLDGHTHPSFEQVLQLAAQRMNVLLIGPTGSGKTHLARQVAKALFPDDDKHFGSVSCSTGMSEGVLLGWMLPVGEGGRFEYVRSEFVRIYEEGGVFLVDEIDAADPNVMLVVNQALANGHLPVPQRRGNPYAERHPDFVLIAAANTYGTGANRLYVGRNQLDEATLDRFRVGQIELDYDKALETALVPHEQLRDRVWAIRERLNALNVNKANLIRRVVSTRFLIDAYRMIEGQGWSVDKAIGQLTTGWTSDERTRAGLSA